MQDFRTKNSHRKNSPPTPFSFIRVSAYEIASVGELKQTTPKVCEQEMKYIRGRPDILRLRFHISPLACSLGVDRKR